MTHAKFVVINQPRDPLTKGEREAIDLLERCGGLSDESMNTQQLYGNWICDMICAGISFSTRKRIISKVTGQLPDEGSTDSLDRLREFRGESPAMAFANLNRLRSIAPELIKVASTRSDIGVLLFTLLTASRSFDEAIKATVTEHYNLLEQFSCIHSPLHHRRKYLFGLEQSQKRMPQLRRETQTAVTSILRRQGVMIDDEGVEGTIRSIWVAAARECGVPFHHIKGVVGSMPRSFDFANSLKHGDITEEERKAILQRVADYILPVRTAWHVMHLRRNVTAEDIQTTLKLGLPHLYADLQFFYPTQSCTRKEGKKTVTELRPLLPEILFFRVSTTLVSSIFRVIGDKAWCYRLVNDSSSPYTVIPQREMELFQRTVAQFTPDVEISLTDEMPIAVGTEVKILSGPLEGVSSIVQEVKADGCNPGKRIYYLRLSSTTNIRWEIELPHTAVTPLTNPS